MSNQTDLFGEPIEDNEPSKHWFGMPEFEQEDLTSFKKIIVHFRNQEDFEKFAELMEQNITPKQQSLWFPYLPPRRYANKRYINEDES